MTGNAGVMPQVHQNLGMHGQQQHQQLRQFNMQQQPFQMQQQQAQQLFFMPQQFQGNMQQQPQQLSMQQQQLQMQQQQAQQLFFMPQQLQGNMMQQQPQQTYQQPMQQHQTTEQPQFSPQQQIDQTDTQTAQGSSAPSAAALSAKPKKRGLVNKPIAKNANSTVPAEVEQPKEQVGQAPVVPIASAPAPTQASTAPAPPAQTEQRTRKGLVNKPISKETALGQEKNSRSAAEARMSVQEEPQITCGGDRITEANLVADRRTSDEFHYSQRSSSSGQAPPSIVSSRDCREDCFPGSTEITASEGAAPLSVAFQPQGVILVPITSCGPASITWQMQYGQALSMPMTMPMPFAGSTYIVPMHPSMPMPTPMPTLAPVPAQPAQLVDQIAQIPYCFFAPFGTKGDALPAFNAAMMSVMDGDNVLFLTQPDYKPMIEECMSRATDFRKDQPILMYTIGQCNDYHYPKDEKNWQRNIELRSPSVSREQVGIQMVVYKRHNGESITFLWAENTSDFSCDAARYEAEFSVENMGCTRAEKFGRLLSCWQAFLDIVQTAAKTAGNHSLKFLTSHCDSLPSVQHFESCMGFESTCILRVGSHCLSDLTSNHTFQDLSQLQRRCYYAQSETLSPKIFTFRSGALSVVHQDIKKEGVLIEPKECFAPRHLPEDIQTFCTSGKPTVVVSISSFGQVDKVIPKFPASDKFQALFLSSKCKNDTDASHLHYEGLVDLDAVFKHSALIVHGGGVGTSNQVAFSGKPSIVISCLCEQENNGRALEKLGVAKHFTLKSLLDNEETVKDFQESILSVFDHPQATWFNADKLKEVQGNVSDENEQCSSAFLQRLRRPQE
jgi:hypothetical protein